MRVVYGPGPGSGPWTVVSVMYIPEKLLILSILDND